MRCTSLCASNALRSGEHSASAYHDADEADDGGNVGAGGLNSGADTSGPYVAKKRRPS